jgi:hypothetical protein
MPVGLSPLTASPIKSKSVAISTSYLNLSTLSIPPKAAGGRRLISGSVRWRDAWKSVPVNDRHIGGTAREPFPL